MIIMPIPRHPRSIRPCPTTTMHAELAGYRSEQNSNLFASISRRIRSTMGDRTTGSGRSRRRTADHPGKPVHWPAATACAWPVPFTTVALEASGVYGHTASDLLEGRFPRHPAKLGRLERLGLPADSTPAVCSSMTRSNLATLRGQMQSTGVSGQHIQRMRNKLMNLSRRPSLAPLASPG